MKSLQDFEVNEKVNIFPNAQRLPAFFNSNLLQESRVVKAFRNDPQANIRVFYYQYLKLCFEVSDCDYEQYIRKIEDIINDSNFNFIFDQTDDPSIFNDIQFKQLIMEFFGLLGEGVASIQACINTHPIIDTVFIYFFRSILILTNVTDSLESYIGRTNLFNVLVSHFNVDMEIHENCVRFPQSDIFVYQERPEEVFMAYIDGEPDSFAPASKEYLSYEASEETIEAPIQLKPAVVKIEPTPQVQNLISAKPQANYSNKEGKIQIKESYIEGQFFDYTSNSPALHTLVKQNKLKQSGDVKDPKFRAKNIQPIVPPFQEKHISKVYQGTVKEESHQKKQPPHNLNAKKQQNKSNESQYNQILNAADNTLNNVVGKKVDTFYSKNLESTFNINGQQSANNPNLASKIATNYTQSNYYPATQKIDPSSGITPLQYNYKSIQESALNQEKKNQSNNFTDFAQLNGFNAGNNSNVGINQTIQQNNVQKQSSSYYNPGFNSLEKFGPKKPTPYDPHIQSSFEAKRPKFFDPVEASSQPSSVLKPPSFGKNPCGLNVSEQFTNSFTMKLMNEPHRSNVTGIRQRARNFRNSLKSFIK